jgi:acetyl esterase/lipase
VPIAPPAGSTFPVRVQVNVPYVQPADPVHVGDLYLPQNQPAALRPGVVILHGRTWADGTKGRPGTVAIARGLAAHGYVAFDINFRLTGDGGTFPHDVQDVRDAVAFLAANAARFRVDVTRLAVVGSGAGGQLAMLAGYAGNTGPFMSPHYGSTTARIGAVATFFAPANLAKLARNGPDPSETAAIASYLGAPYAGNPQLYAQASPTSYLPTAVSTIIFHGDHDSTVSIWQPFDLYQKLRQEKVPSTFVDLSGAPQSLADLTPQQRSEALSRIVSFFDGVFYRPQPAS